MLEKGFRALRNYIIIDYTLINECTRALESNVVQCRKFQIVFAGLGTQCTMLILLISGWIKNILLTPPN